MSGFDLYKEGRVRQLYMGRPRNRIRKRGGRHQEGWRDRKRERWSALYSFSYWVEDRGDRRAACILGKLSTARGLSLGSSASVHRFRRLHAATREMFAGAECEIRPDNARTQLYSAYFRPAGKRKESLRYWGNRYRS